MLAVSAARYHRDLRDHELLIAQTQARLSEARLDALKAQLNPHFFFNTLNAISALALRRDHAAVADSVSRLGNLMRISLDSKRPHQIALEQEMEFLDGYIEIARLSIGDRLSVAYEVTPEARTALVPSMILQPIVENAIRHGIGARPGAGRITVAAWRETDALRISVVDDGPGFQRTAIPGIGLRNAFFWDVILEVTIGNVKSRPTAAPWSPVVARSPVTAGQTINVSVGIAGFGWEPIADYKLKASME